MYRLRMLKNNILLLPPILFLIFAPVLALDWQWVRDDLLINPSGVQSYGFTRIDLGDIDGDSWLDLVVLDSVGMRMYQNRGLNNTISFERRLDWEFDIKPDPSKKEIPTLADLDGDGRADLILPDRRNHSLKYWLNNGNAAGNFWIRADSVMQTIICGDFVEFADLDNDYVLSNPTLARVDWDGDGVFEFILGANKTIGSVSLTILIYFKNGEAKPDFFSNFSQDSLFHDPTLADINDDGMLDLFLQKSGHYLFFENSGTLASPKWEERPQWSEDLTKTEHYRAEIGDLTKDGLLDIVFGETDGTLSLFRNIGSKLFPQWEQVADVFQNVRVDSFAIPTLVDLDYDADLDLVLGDHFGRFSAFRNDVATLVSDETVDSRRLLLFQNFPNPFNSTTKISYTLTSPAFIKIHIFDILGQQVQTFDIGFQQPGKYNKIWRGDNQKGALVSSGIYYYLIQSEHEILYQGVMTFVK